MELHEAIKLVAKLSRTRNFPQSEDGVEDFARSLMRSSEMFGVDPGLVVQTCADSSEFCPTDADLLSVARDLKEEARRQREAASPSQIAQWRKTYGPPVPFETVADPKPEWYEKAQANIKRREELWSKLRERFPGAGRRGKDWPDWLVLSKAARELGYPDYADAWEKSVKW